VYYLTQFKDEKQKSLKSTINNPERNCDDRNVNKVHRYEIITSVSPAVIRDKTKTSVSTEVLRDKIKTSVCLQ
jgi:hypothetical protein